MQAFLLSSFLVAVLGSPSLQGGGTGRPDEAPPEIREERTLSPPPLDRRKGFHSITPEQCKKWLSYIASDELAGRETGHPGYKLAAEFIAERFEEFGLRPVGKEGSYFQHVPFEGTRVMADRSYLALLDEEGEVLIKIAAGQGLGGSIREKSDRIMDLAYLEAESAEDLEDVDVEGKALILVDRSPEMRWGLTEVRMALFRLGRSQPAAVIRVNDASARVALEKQMRVSFAGKGRRRGRSMSFRRPNRYALTEASARRLLAAAGVKEDAAIGDRLQGYKLKAHIEVESRPVFAANVIGLLEGSDPELGKEIVGIGSHLDHIGVNARGQINNGADDDGSGTTGVLAVAKAFSVNGKRPRRSLLFMCFCGEEKGLIGSRYYAENPIFPNERMVAELQMDMIGRSEEHRARRNRPAEPAEENRNSLHLIGTRKLSEELHGICVEMNEKHVGFDFEYDEENVFFRSDHVNFAKKGIPIAFFFTGFHPQYHRPNDTVDRIDFPKLARVAKLVYAIAFDLADREARPKVDRSYEEATKGRRRRRR